MIQLLLVSLLVAAAILLLGRRLSLGGRLALALCAFVFFNLPTIVFLVVGDGAPPGARIVAREELAESR
ncbi:MAG: hypothetical protein R2864_01475 [Syntrophotaleaceae bacterium]